MQVVSKDRVAYSTRELAFRQISDTRVTSPLAHEWAKTSPWPLAHPTSNGDGKAWQVDSIDSARDSAPETACPEEAGLHSTDLLLSLLDEGYEKKTWHGPNLKQSLKGVTAKQAAWRPGPGRHNIWELSVHAAYWKYAVRRRIEGGKRGSFALKGSNFFTRPERGGLNEQAWRADRELLEREHLALRDSIARAISASPSLKLLRSFYGIAFHDIYHAGQIRLLRRLMQRRSGSQPAKFGDVQN